MYRKGKIRWLRCNFSDLVRYAVKLVPLVCVFFGGGGVSSLRMMPLFNKGNYYEGEICSKIYSETSITSVHTLGRAILVKCTLLFCREWSLVRNQLGCSKFF